MHSPAVQNTRLPREPAGRKPSVRYLSEKSDMPICIRGERIKKHFKLIEIYFMNSFISKLSQAPGPKQLLSFLSWLLWSLLLWVMEQLHITKKSFPVVGMQTACALGKLSWGVHSIVLYPCSRMQTKMGKQAKITNHAGTWQLYEFQSCISVLISVSSVSPVYFPLKYMYKWKIKGIRTLLEKEVISELGGTICS